MNRVCIYCNTGHFIEIFEIQLEIAQKHLDNGDEVDFLFCDGTIPICEINLKKDIDTCLYCIGRRNNGFSKLKGQKNKFNLIKFTNLNDLKIIQEFQSEFQSINDLKDLYYDKLDLGICVYSSIADINREHKPEYKNYKNEIGHFIKSALRIYFCSNSYLKKRKPERVYIFNGRHALEKPMIAACQKNQIDYYTHELAYNGGYNICKNTQPHDFSFYTKKAEELWNDPNTSARIKQKLGRLFFDNKLGHRQGRYTISKSKNDISIQLNNISTLDTVEQMDILPKFWSKKNHNILIFQSSIFEQFTAPDFYKQNSLYNCQIEGIIKIIKHCLNNEPQIKFFLRLHPCFNFWNNKTQELDEFLSLENTFDNLYLIKPYEKISSYYLMENADKVLSFRSTTAIEAAYKKIPSIVLESWAYEGYNCIYKPSSHPEVIELVTNTSLRPKKNEDCLKFGYLQMSYGHIPKYYKRDPNKSYEENWGRFKGYLLEPGFTYKFIIQILHRNKLNLFHNTLNKIHNLLIYFFHNKKLFNNNQL